MNPLVTVFVTVYNIQEYLPRFFESMKNQTFGAYKLLIFEDGSTDNSLEVCKTYAAADSRIQIVELPHIGISAARNLIKKYVDTPFVASADGDDYVEPSYLSNLIDAQSRYDADLVISRVIYREEDGITEQGRFIERGEVFIPRSEFVRKIPMLLDDRRLNFLYAKLYRAELFNKVEIEPNIKPGSDTMMNCRFLKNCNSILLIDALDYNYIKYSSGAVTSAKGADVFHKLIKLNKYVSDIMSENGYMSEELQLMIDKRILLSAIWLVDGIVSTDWSLADKERQISDILESQYYREVFNRSNDKLNNFAIEPQSGHYYMSRLQHEKRINSMKASILRIVPEWMHKIYLKGK